MKKYSLGELIADAVSHGVGVILSLTGLILIIIRAQSSIGLISGVVYGFCLVFLYTSSTLFHSFPRSFKRTRSVFQRLDHSGVFLLIVGTYTPIIVFALDQPFSIIYLSLLWLLTIVGIVFKSIWIKKYKGIHLAIYLLMGWSVVFVWNDVFPMIQPMIDLIVTGGLLYTVGVVFYLWPFKYHHFVWHLFVMAGSIAHFFVIYQIV